MAITWVAPLDKPTNVTASAGDSGSGSIPAGTYYFRIVADTEYSPTSSTALHRDSPPSDYVSVTVDGTQSITLNWDAVTDANYYRVYYSEGSSDNWTSVNDYCITNYNNGYYGGITTNSVTFTDTFDPSSYRQDYWQATFFGYNPHGIVSLDKGIGYVDISGDVGNITLTDIANVIPDTNKIYDPNGTLIIYGYVVWDSAATGSISIKNGTFEMFKKDLVTPDGFSITLDNMVIQIHKWLPSIYIYNGTLRKSIVKEDYPNIVWLYETPSIYVQPDTTFSTDGNQLNVSQVFFTKANAGALNIDTVGSLNYRDTAPSVDTEITDASTTQYFTFYWSNQDWQHLFIRRFSIYNDNQHVETYWAGQNFALYDCNFYDSSGNKVDPKWAGNAYVGNVLHIYYSVNLTVVDKDGNPLEGATVEITNNDSNTITLTTDANGQIRKDLEVMAVTKTDGGQDIERYNPFSLTISKDGYQTYTATNITLDDEFTETIALQTGSIAYRTCTSEDSLSDITAVEDALKTYSESMPSDWNPIFQKIHLKSGEIKTVSIIYRSDVNYVDSDFIARAGNLDTGETADLPVSFSYGLLTVFIPESTIASLTGDDVGNVVVDVACGHDKVWIARFVII